MTSLKSTLEERYKEIVERDKEIMRLREENKALQQGTVKMESTIFLL